MGHPRGRRRGVPGDPVRPRRLALRLDRRRLPGRGGAGVAVGVGARAQGTQGRCDARRRRRARAAGPSLPRPARRRAARAAHGRPRLDRRPRGGARRRRCGRHRPAEPLLGVRPAGAAADVPRRPRNGRADAALRRREDPAAGRSLGSERRGFLPRQPVHPAPPVPHGDGQRAVLLRPRLEEGREGGHRLGARPRRRLRADRGRRRRAACRRRALSCRPHRPHRQGVATTGSRGHSLRLDRPARSRPRRQDPRLLVLDRDAAGAVVRRSRRRGADRGREKARGSQRVVEGQTHGKGGGRALEGRPRRRGRGAPPLPAGVARGDARPADSRHPRRTRGSGPRRVGAELGLPDPPVAPARGVRPPGQLPRQLGLRPRLGRVDRGPLLRARGPGHRDGSGRVRKARPRRPAAAGHHRLEQRRDSERGADHHDDALQGRLDRRRRRRVVLRLGQRGLRRVVRQLLLRRNAVGGAPGLHGQVAVLPPHQGDHAHDRLHRHRGPQRAAARVVVAVPGAAADRRGPGPLPHIPGRAPLAPEDRPPEAQARGGPGVVRSLPVRHAARR